MTRLAPLALLGALALSACSAAPEATTAPPPTAAKPKPSPSSACLTVPAALLSSIASGAKPGVGRLKLTGGTAVPANAFSHIYLVAAHISAPGVHGTGVWATIGLTAGKWPYLAADGSAQRVTKWPKASNSAANISAGDPGVRAARACL